MVSLALKDQPEDWTFASSSPGLPAPQTLSVLGSAWTSSEIHASCFEAATHLFCSAKISTKQPKHGRWKQASCQGHCFFVLTFSRYSCSRPSGVYLIQICFNSPCCITQVCYSLPVSKHNHGLGKCELNHPGCLQPWDFNSL